MESSKILVTGGSGFIGTNLIEYLLEKNHQVLNVDIKSPLDRRHGPHWLKGDILEERFLGETFLGFMPDYVVHLAARTDIAEKKSLDGYRVNTEGTKNVLKAIAKIKSVKRAIVASSMLVCGLGYLPKDDSDYNPPNLYGESKARMERIVREFGLPCEWLIIRPTTVWGPWSIRYRAEFFSILQRGFYFHPGRKTVCKTYGYVGNVANQIYRFLEAPSKAIHEKTLYIGDPPIDLRTWVDKFSQELCGKGVRVVPRWVFRGVATIGDIIALTGLSVPLTTFRLVNMVTPNILDVDTAIRITGFPIYNVDDGVRLTIAWLRAYGKS
jgi:GlcNAc-P-P-Und epimerase